MSSSSAGTSGLSILGTVEGGCGRLKLGVSLVSLLQNLLGFIASQTLLSCELEGLEAGMSGACLHLSITVSLPFIAKRLQHQAFDPKKGIYQGLA